MAIIVISIVNIITIMKTKLTINNSYTLWLLINHYYYDNY